MLAGNDSKCFLVAGGRAAFGDWGTSRLYVLGWRSFSRPLQFLSHPGDERVDSRGRLGLHPNLRIYPDGGGVYTAAKHKSRTLAVVGALLLFADYTVTASLSALDAFHYFGLPLKHQVAQSAVTNSAARADTTVKDAGDTLDIHRDSGPSTADSLFSWDSPGLWAIVAILLIGAFNLMGPKHTGGFAFSPPSA